MVDSDPSQRSNRKAVRNTVIGAPVDEAKAGRAREFRKAPTYAERVLWHCLRANRLAGLHFRRQQVIDGYIVDFYCHAVAVIIEVDGEAHESHKDSDADRDRPLTNRGFMVVRFRNDGVLQDIDAVLRRVEAACVERLSASPLPPGPLPEAGEGEG